MDGSGRVSELVKKQVYFVRHGETEWNALKKFQGHTDIPLNENGRQQAETLIELVSKIDPHFVLSSDLSRALETAQIACREIQISIMTHPELRETHLGAAEGMMRDDLFDKHGEDLMNRWFSTEPEDAHFSFPGGETKHQCMQRVKGFLQQWWLQSKDRHQAERVMVFSHGGVIRNMVHSSLDAPETPVLISNCVCQLLEYDLQSGQWRYVRQVNS